jgi:hypothetical protein
MRSLHSHLPNGWAYIDTMDPWPISLLSFSPLMAMAIITSSLIHLARELTFVTTVAECITCHQRHAPICCLLPNFISICKSLFQVTYSLCKSSCSSHSSTRGMGLVGPTPNPTNFNMTQEMGAESPPRNRWNNIPNDFHHNWKQARFDQLKNIMLHVHHSRFAAWQTNINFFWKNKIHLSKTEFLNSSF